MERFRLFSLEGKTILVTGASSGIGRGIAETISQMGANVILNGRNEQRLEETLQSLHKGEHKVCACDITHQKELDKMVQSLPLLDGVVHCAGVGQRLLAKQITLESLNQVMSVNFTAPVLLQSTLLMKKKLQRGASVIFIASIASWSPSIGNSAYSASKGALISYANCLSLELAPRNIRVNCISPAMVWTNLAMQEEVDIEQLKEDEQRYPLKRYGTPEDVANLAVFLLSDASSWMTGSNIKLSGGVVSLSK